MKRLLFLALLAAAVWYGWRNLPALFERRVRHEAVVENLTGVTVERLRLRVGGQTFVRESLPDNDRAVFPFHILQDSSFELQWQRAGSEGEYHWKGGLVTAGPLVQRHRLTLDAEGAVFYRAERR